MERVVAWQMGIALPLFAAGGFLWESVQWQNLSWIPVLGLTYQGVVIAGLGFMVTSYLIKQHNLSVIAGFGFVSPISGVLLSIWLLSEQPTITLYLGMMAVGLGLFLITRK